MAELSGQAIQTGDMGGDRQIPYIKVKTQTKRYVDLDNNKDGLQFTVYGLKSGENVHEDSQVIQKSAYFVKGFDDLKQIADSLQIPFYIYLHAEQGELKVGRYNDMGQRILLCADSAQVTLMNGMEEGERPEMYRDVIHFNEMGQRHLADVLKTIIE